MAGGVYAVTCEVPRRQGSGRSRTSPVRQWSSRGNGELLVGNLVMDEVGGVLYTTGMHGGRGFITESGMAGWDVSWWDSIGI